MHVKLKFKNNCIFTCMSSEEKLQQRIKQLEEQLASQSTTVKLKVSQKGCVQINGIRRMPITLYRQEMETILDMAEEIRTFIQENSDELSVKG